MDKLGQVFISYSHDSVDHVQRVLDLSNKLRAEGIDCILDQYETSPLDGWPRWMDKNIRFAQYVLSICTESYFCRVMGEECKGKGLGVKWEGSLIYQHIYNADSSNEKFIPVIFSDSHRKYIPTPLQGATYYCIDSEEGYENLYWRLLGKSRVEKPKLGELRALPEKPVKTDPKMYLTGPINVELWDKAIWRAIFIICYPDMPPAFGLVFKNEKIAREIFTNWHNRYGSSDEYEELRISVIEGNIPGEEPGYSVHVGSDLDAAIERFRKAGYEFNDDLLMSVSRIHRMNPPADSKNLEMFKQAYRKYKTYFLIPVVMSDDETKIKPIFELGIYKGKIHFRNVSDIKDGDIDSVVIKSAIK